MIWTKIFEVLAKPFCPALIQDWKWYSSSLDENKFTCENKTTLINTLKSGLQIVKSISFQKFLSDFLFLTLWFFGLRNYLVGPSAGNFGFSGFLQTTIFSFLRSLFNHDLDEYVNVIKVHLLQGTWVLWNISIDNGDLITRESLSKFIISKFQCKIKNNFVFFFL